MNSLARKQNYRAVMRKSSGQTGKNFHAAVLKLGSAGMGHFITLREQNAGGVPAARRYGPLSLK